jgi:hypothetical protein
MIYVEVWLAIVGLTITLLGVLLKAAMIYGDIKHQIKRNYADINRMGNSLREEISRKDKVIQFLIEDIQQHLNDSSNYQAPSIRLEDD